MKVEIIPSRPSVDFNFDSACTSPYVSAPSSPQRFGNYFFSAPASPARISASSASFDHFYHDDESMEGTTDFAFDFSGQLERPSLSADELFDGGVIKPLKPATRSEVGDTNTHSKKELERFSEAIQQTGSGHRKKDQRGRERTTISPSSSSRHKSSRSLSPLRVSDLLVERENNHQNPNEPCSSPSPVSAGSTWYSKWKLKELLFRSKSEGSTATNKDPLKKLGLLKRRESEDLKNSSFRSTESSNLGTSLRRKGISGSVSAHEWHYTMNRAASEEMRRKTFLPYKQGWLGCLGFSPVNLSSSILTRQ